MVYIFIMHKKRVSKPPDQPSKSLLPQSPIGSLFGEGKRERRTPLANTKKKSLKILVVEPDADYALSLSDVLERDGHNITIMQDPLRAVVNFASGHFDAVICESYMKEQNTGQFIRDLRVRGFYQPVIIITNIPLTVATARLQGCDVLGILCKPVNNQDLKRLLSEIKPMPR